jgi:hypothetical protein
MQNGIDLTKIGVSVCWKQESKRGEISMEKEEQKKAKKKINMKIRDIAPKKDAKGGSASSDPCEGGRVKRP